MLNYDIQAGFSRVNITPPLGIDMGGYFIQRIADGILDNLEINTLALRKQDKTVLLMAFDTLGMWKEYVERLKDAITKATDIPADAILIHSTHTHTSGRLGNGPALTPQETAYGEYVLQASVTAAVNAIQDLKNSKLGLGVSEAKHIAFNRRYLMKDGSTRTNPGVNNPDIVQCIGLLDEQVNVLRFLREDGSNLVIVNFGNHPDTIGGTKISADWPGFTRRTLERALENTKCIVFNGAQGDINHVNVFPKGGDLNDMFLDFDNVSRGYGHSRHLGNVLAGAVMQVYDKVTFTNVDELNYVQKTIFVRSNKPKTEEMEEARYIHQMHMNGKDSELPYAGMLLTTAVADAARKIRMENSPDYLPLPLSAIKIGNIAFVGIPGEPFAGIGIALKETEGWDMILPCCMANAKEGYFPMKDSYEEGGYEAKSSPFASGVAEQIIQEGVSLLHNLKNNS